MGTPYTSLFHLFVLNVCLEIILCEEKENENTILMENALTPVVIIRRIPIYMERYDTDLRRSMQSPFGPPEGGKN